MEFAPKVRTDLKTKRLSGHNYKVYGRIRRLTCRSNVWTGIAQEPILHQEVEMVR